MDIVVETSRALFFTAPNLQFRKGKTQRKSSSKRWSVAGVVEVIVDVLRADNGLEASLDTK